MNTIIMEKRASGDEHSRTAMTEWEGKNMKGSGRCGD